MYYRSNRPQMGERLPVRRRWYDLEAAAERLGCTRSDLEYYIKEGQLRFAVSTQRVLKPTGVVLMRNSDLPETVQGRLGSMVKPDLMRCFETTFSDTLAESVQEPGEFLYLPFGWLPRMYVTEDGFDEVRAQQLWKRTTIQSQSSVRAPMVRRGVS